MAIKLREWINEHSGLVVSATVLVLVVVAIFVGLRSFRGPQAFEEYDLWCIDLHTNKLFAARSTDIPPFDAPSGELLEDGEPAGVRAYVYTCGECEGDLAGKTPEEVEELGLFVAYYEKYAPDLKERMLERQRVQEETGRPGPEFRMVVGRLLRLPDQEQWHDAATVFGREIEIGPSRQCDDPSTLQLCGPG